MRSSHLTILAVLLTAAPCLAQSSAVIGEMYASDASVRGSVLFASGGTQIESGSSVSAGDAAALLKLKRGGEVRICPRTTVSVASSANGRDLLMGMNTGSMEAHYSLSASADTVMTPDFRILLAGPGTFHFAISADAQGNSCVKALPSNTASLIVNELNGDATYQVKPNEQVYFRAGHITSPDPLVPAECGCPPPPPSFQVEATGKALEHPGTVLTQSSFGAPLPLPTLPNSFAPDVKPVDPANAHLEMESPFIYKAGAPELELALAVGRLRLTSDSTLPQAVVLPPPVKGGAKATTITASGQKPAQKQQRKGFFGKIGSFFSSIFR
ncbi:MAG TPA: hypothetical protein VFP40_10980 [Terriglobales bacterium]|nr:hypothetical protein [Terriglobales bacterium]